MSAAPVWLRGGTCRTDRKTALSRASLCVIVVLQDGGHGRGGGGTELKAGETPGLMSSVLRIGNSFI